MGKSLVFVKERIASGQCNGMENNKYESMIEQDIRELFTVITCTKDGTILANIPYLKGDKPYFKGEYFNERSMRFAAALNLDLL